MNIWMFPKFSKTNKYNELLSKALEEKGVNIKDFRQRYIFKMKKNDILHVHWTHSIYQSNIKSLFILKSLIVLFFIKVLRLKGIKFVWTVHNLYPHSYKFKKLEKWIRKTIMNECSFIIVAANSLKQNVLKEYSIPEEKIKVIPHGHYKNAYKIKGENIREKYNIEKQDYLYLFLGAIKPYKGVDSLLLNFQKLSQTNKEEKNYLLVAGNASEEIQQELIKQSGNSNIIFDFRFIPDDEIADIILACDAVVLPYKEITTSGSAILALSFNKPIVAPKTPFLVEYFNLKNSILYNDTEENSLFYAMEEIKVLSKNNTKKDFEDSIKRLEWSEIAKSIITEYQKAVVE